MAMAETQTKRPREEPPTLLDDDSKRHRPYTPILNLLDDADEDNELILDPSQDLSATILSTLQQELSTSAFPHPPPANGGDDDEDDAVKSVMRHLLEASDDELGIPNRATTDDDDDNNKNKSHETLNSSAGDFPYDLDGLWEFEDEAENYYTASPSELLM